MKIACSATASAFHVVFFSEDDRKIKLMKESMDVQLVNPKPSMTCPLLSLKMAKKR